MSCGKINRWAWIWLLAAVGVSAVWADQAPAGEHDRFISRTRQLTFEGRRSGEGYFSSDGSRLIFQSERYRDNPFYQIYTLDLATGRTRLVSPGVGRTTCSFFRPGSNEVLFASTHLDPQAREVQRREYEIRQDPNRPHVPWIYDEQFDIFSCDDRGRRLSRLTDAPGYDAEGAYSPDGELIVFMTMRDAYPIEKLSEKEREMWEKQPEYFGELYIMDADGSNQRRLTDWPGYDGGPFFTADGKRVIWRHFEENGLIADIYTVKIDGTDKRRLTDFKSMSWAPYMHPSGEYAVFNSNKLGFANFELFIVDAVGKKQPIQVTYTDGFDGLPVFSPDGDRLCWASSRTATEPHTAHLFMADWDHRGALAALKAAPPRGTEEPAPDFDTPPITSWPDSKPPTIEVGLKTAILAEDLYEHVSYLACDKLEGRMTGTDQARMAADYIAARFKEAGLQPLGDNGTYFQEFAFQAGVQVVPEKNRLTVGSKTSPAEPLVLDKDYRPLSFTTNATASGEVVFVGYGLVVPGETDKKQYDSYKNRDVAGKIVLALDDVPADVDTNERIRFSHYSSPHYKAKQALKHGAAGFLLIADPDAAGQLPPLDYTGGGGAGIVSALITAKVADRLLDGSGVSLHKLRDMLDGGEVPDHIAKMNPGSRVELTTCLDHKEGKCRNVIGLLPSTGDSDVADQYVLIGAHYDHIGRGEAGGSRALSGEKGQIHNGADDNASGTATVLELAANIADARARDDSPGEQRNLIFACWSGEEIGVVGSTHFARHAPCPLGQIAAYVNFDMVGRLRDGKLILQGLGSSPDWMKLIETVNIRQPLALVIQKDPYLPTDTHEFYPAGVPIISFFTGVHDDYNRPTDDADTLNYAGMEHIALFGRHLISELAKRPTRPAHKSVERSMPTRGGGGRGRVFTGTVPDFLAGDVKGMKIKGTQGGSPAEKAGMIAGDIIIELAEHEITGLGDYAVVLRALKPDEAVEIVVKRDGKELRLEITPTARK